jgi:hypothetical protein
MAKRKSTPAASSAPPNDSIVEQRVVQFAEQMGRILGTVRAQAEGLVDVQTLSSQISSIRDAAADLLTHIGREDSGTAAATPVAPPQTRRSRGPVDAPGKRHRKAAPSVRGAKHSDTRIAKGRLAKLGRSPRRG